MFTMRNVWHSLLPSHIPAFIDHQSAIISQTEVISNTRCSLKVSFEINYSRLLLSTCGVMGHYLISDAVLFAFCFMNCFFFLQRVNSNEVLLLEYCT